MRLLALPELKQALKVPEDCWRCKYPIPHKGYEKCKGHKSRHQDIVMHAALQKVLLTFSCLALCVADDVQASCLQPLHN